MKVGMLNSFSSLLAILAMILSATIFGSDENLYPDQRGVSTYYFDSFGTPSGSYSVSDYSPKNLDTYKSWNFDDYQIEVELPITRFIPDLQNSVSIGAVNKNVEIFIPAYDIDSNEAPLLDCDRDGIPEQLNEEVDEVYLNGIYIGTLTGEDNEWELNKFIVPIESINMPRFEGDKAINRISIKIDAANKEVPLSSGRKGCTTWGASIDWISLKLKVADPIYVLAGLGGSTESLDNSNFANNIEDKVGVNSKVFGHKQAQLSLTTCTPKKLLALTAQAEEFMGYIADNSSNVGTAKFNLIGYSMGGLASRMIYKEISAKDPVQVNTMDNMPVYEKLDINSIMTVGTPHQGTLVADIIDSTPAGLLIQDLCELRPYVMKSDLNTLNSLAITVPLAVVASDADINENRVLDEEENEPGSLDYFVAKPMYNYLYNYESITIEYYSTLNNYLGEYKYPDQIVKKDFENLNDTMVTINSATTLENKDYTLFLISEEGGNHRTIIFSNAQNSTINFGLENLGWGKY